MYAAAVAVCNHSLPLTTQMRQQLQAQMAVIVASLSQGAAVTALSISSHARALCVAPCTEHTAAAPCHNQSLLQRVHLYSQPRVSHTHPRTLAVATILTMEPARPAAAAAPSSSSSAADAASSLPPLSPVMAAPAAPSDYSDLPALASTPIVADLSLTQGSSLTQQDKSGAGGNLVEVLKQMWINERGERK